MSLEFLIKIKQAEEEIYLSKDINSLEKIRVKYLGKKGFFTVETIKLRYLSSKNKIIFGSLLNNTKKNIYKLIYTRKKELESVKIKNILEKENIDISLPGRSNKHGNLHPVSKSIYIIESFFKNIGFSIVSGSEIEDENHNFDYLNISKYHPTRTNNDTFWLSDKFLLRTQTSSIQIREMQNNKPPIKIITSGKVYRNDYDSSHTPMFNQVEGFVVDTNVSFSNLKSIIINFLKNFFNKEKIKIRFRPSYFPFTEPSAEADIMNQHGKWIEVLGCGMIHPKVLKNANIDSKKYSGLAFGMGVERLISLRYGINDLRELFENDLRFLQQFK